MNSDIHLKYWSLENKKMLEKAVSIVDLWNIAKDILKKLDKVAIVSGPISTGGTGNRKTNGEVFKRAIEIMSIENSSIKVFSQFPFEDKMAHYYEKWRIDNPHAGYCMPILDDFYKPLFESGKIEKVYFIHGWESSFGAKWEHNKCKALNISIEYLPKELTEKIVSKL